jgi:CheY-like chemotaxis protein
MNADANTVKLNAHMTKKRTLKRGASEDIEAGEYSRCRAWPFFGKLDPSMNEAGSYVVQCHKCALPFDALQTSWCSCLVSERTLACPSCGSCFCKAPLAYKSKFWAGAPKEMWDRKLEEKRQPFDPPANPAPGEALRPLVLLVDDEKDVQRVAIRVIEGLGYGVVLGRDGVEGLELARLYKPDLVLTDALMPKLDGREMGRRIKDDPETAHIKVVVMTGLYTNPKYQTEGFRTFKVDDYLIKPLDSEQLRAVLGKHLGAPAANRAG